MDRCYRKASTTTNNSNNNMRRSSSTVSDDELAELLSWQQQQQLVSAVTATSPGCDATNARRYHGRRRESIAPALTHGSNFGRVEVQYSSEHHQQQPQCQNQSQCATTTDDKWRADSQGEQSCSSTDGTTTRFPWQRDVSVQCTIVSTSMVEGLLAPDDVAALLKPQNVDTCADDDGLDARGRPGSNRPAGEWADECDVTQGGVSRTQKVLKWWDGGVGAAVEVGPIQAARAARRRAISDIQRPDMAKLCIVYRSDTEDESIDTSTGTSPTSDVGSDAIVSGRDLMLRHLQRFNKSLAGSTTTLNSNESTFSGDTMATSSSRDFRRRSDVITSPRVSPISWMYASSIPDVVVTSVVNQSGKSSASPFVRRRENLLTVPAKSLRHNGSSSTIYSTSDPDSDTESTPPAEQTTRQRRLAMLPVMTAVAQDDASPTNSCDESDTARKPSGDDIGVAANLFTHTGRTKTPFLRHKTIAEFYNRSSSASSNTSIDQPDNKGNLRKFLNFIKKPKPELDDVLRQLKPSSFKDDRLRSFKHVHWSELIAGKDRDDGEGACLSDSERKRREAVWELFKSELVFFLDHLMVIKHCFMEPLKRVQVEGQLLFTEPQDLFGNLDDLCLMSYTFCKDFISMLQQDATPADFGKTEALIKALQRLTRDGELYHDYCLNYTKAVTVLDNYRKIDSFVEFERWCENDPRCNRLQLQDLLISPMQHTTKMPLLLSNIRRWTEDEEDRRRLTALLDKLETSLVHLEEKMKWLKNYERIQEIQQQISWPPITDLDPRAYIPEFLRQKLSHQPCERLLASPKRQLVYEGQLSLLEANNKVVDNMYLFLFDDLLLLTKIKKPARKQKTASTAEQTPRALTEGAQFVVHRQPLALDRFVIHDIKLPDGASVRCMGGLVVTVCPNPAPRVLGLGEGLQWGRQLSMDSERQVLLLHIDGCAQQLQQQQQQQQWHHPTLLLFSCMSPASTVKNGFVLTHISRFRQIVGVFTFLATSETAKATWLNHLRTCQEKYQEACKKSPSSPLTYTSWTGTDMAAMSSPKRGRSGKSHSMDKRSESVEAGSGSGGSASGSGSIDRTPRRRFSARHRNGSEVSTAAVDFASMKDYASSSSSNSSGAATAKDFALSSPSRRLSAAAKAAMDSDYTPSSALKSPSVSPTSSLTPTASPQRQHGISCDSNALTSSSMLSPSSAGADGGCPGGGGYQQFSKSPPRSPGHAQAHARAYRSKRDTLKALHEKSKTMDVIYL